MANWRDEYHAALLVRDERQQANSSLYDACKKKEIPEADSNTKH